MGHTVTHKRFEYVDILRCIAILGVILVHTAQYGSGETGLPSLVVNIVHEGARGVQLFFMMSAFTIFLTFKKSLPQERFSYSNFFIRRFFRIAPLFYIAIAYYLWQNGIGYTAWLGDEEKITNANIISSFLFINGFYPPWFSSLVPGGWSIAVEMTFYSLVPLLARYIINLKTAIQAFFIAIILKTTMHLLFTQFPLISATSLWNTYLFLYFPSQLPIFLLGFILYFLIMNDNNSKNNLPAVFLAFFPILLLNKINFPHFETSLLIWGITFFGLVIVLNEYLKSNFFTQFLARIGRVSYSMYLAHFAVLFWLNKFQLLDYIGQDTKITATINFSIRFLLVTSITFLLSLALYKIIELPGIALGAKLIKRRETA